MGHVAAQIFKRAIERNNRECCCCKCKHNTAHYVKSTRYKAGRCGDHWGVYRITKVAAHTIEAVHASGIHSLEAAERIAAIYEEVMP